MGLGGGGVPHIQTGRKLGPNTKQWLHFLIDLMQIWRLLISINGISSIKEMNPITRKSVSKLVTQPSFRAVGQTHAEWQTFEKPENKRQIMYGSQAWVDWVPYIFSNVCHFVCVWTTARKLGCITNLDMLFLVMFSLIDAIQFLLRARSSGTIPEWISSRHLHKFYMYARKTELGWWLKW